MLCGENGALNEISDAIGEVSEAIDTALATYAKVVALLAQIESIATNLVPTLLAQLQAEGGLIADMLELATIRDPFAFAAKVIEIEKKYGKGTVSDLGWDSFPPSFSLADICEKVENLQEDGTVVPKEPTAPKAAPTKEEPAPSLSDAVDSFNDALDEAFEGLANFETDLANSLKAAVSGVTS